METIFEHSKTSSRVSVSRKAMELEMMPRCRLMIVKLFFDAQLM
jgi:hypothetical protein